MTAAPPTFPGSPAYSGRDRDDDHLRILSIFYYIWGGLTTLLVLCPGSIYLVIGITMLASPESWADDHTGDPAPAAVGWIMIAVALAVYVIGLAFAALSFYAGRCLARKTHRTFCFVVAGLTCLSIPFGTILGVFTIVVLARDSVAAKFARRRGA